VLAAVTAPTRASPAGSRAPRRGSRRLVRIAGVAIFAATLAGASSSSAQCDDADVAAARRRLERACPCTETASHKAYLDCAGRFLDRQIGRGKLSPACRPPVMQCARKSVCGRLEHTAACVTRGAGPRCRIMHAGVALALEAEGDVCMRGFRSCCDVECEAESCVSEPPRTCGDPNTPGAGFPQCGGTCAPGYVCQGIVNAPDGPNSPPAVEWCMCVRPDRSCDGFGQCSEDILEVGVCPPGEHCWAYFGGVHCICNPMDLAARSASEARQQK
jgi:hypothetical protein